MSYDFDSVIDRRCRDASKWKNYGDDILPLWVADMDFQSPEVVIEAIQERAAHGVFGYTRPPAELYDVICARMQRLYQWLVTPEDILFLPGLVCGLNVVCRATGRPGQNVLMQTPIYPPFLSAPGYQGLGLDIAPLTYTTRANTLYYEIDEEVFEAAITPQTCLFTLCNPHNPIGRSYTPAELGRLAEICLRHDLIICADEIHADLMLDGTRHTPIASLSPEIAQRCITLHAPSKSFNLPGLGCGFAIIQNPDLRRQIEQAKAGIVPGINIMGLVAALAAYTEGESWLSELRCYLTHNRDFLIEYVAEHLPDIRTTAPEATYLAWLDCRRASIEGNPFEFFLKQARVAFNDGAHFGVAGEGFVRLNFGCPRPILTQALEQVKTALVK